MNFTVNLHELKCDKNLRLNGHTSSSATILTAKRTIHKNT